MARVLIVDDHRFMLNALRDAIELGKEHTVTVVARSADDVIEMLRDKKIVDSFDVAIVDGLRGEGVTVAVAIRQLGKPVIGFSLGTVTFGNINLQKGVGRQVILDAIATLTKVSAEIEK